MRPDTRPGYLLGVIFISPVKRKPKAAAKHRGCQSITCHDSDIISNLVQTNIYWQRYTEVKRLRSEVHGAPDSRPWCRSGEGPTSSQCQRHLWYANRAGTCRSRARRKSGAKSETTTSHRCSVSQAALFSLAGRLLARPCQPPTLLETFPCSRSVVRFKHGQGSPSRRYVFSRVRERLRRRGQGQLANRRAARGELARGEPACHRESVRAAECQLSTPRTTVN
jgi:hypothetical protein